jgi:predicted branched-subunit amino acid permease
VLTTLPAGTPQRQMVLVALLNQGWWVLGTAIGAVIGAQAQVSLQVLDFALIALFAVLTVEQWRGRQTGAPLWVALVAYALSYAVVPQQALMLAIVLSLAAGIFWQRRQTEVAHG